MKKSHRSVSQRPSYGAGSGRLIVVERCYRVRLADGEWERFLRESPVANPTLPPDTPFMFRVSSEPSIARVAPVDPSIAQKS